MAYYKPSIITGLRPGGTGGLYGQNGAYGNGNSQNNNTNGGYTVTIGAGAAGSGGNSSPSSPTSPTTENKDSTGSNYVAGTVTPTGGAGTPSSGAGAGTGTGGSGTTYQENITEDKLPTAPQYEVDTETYKASDTAPPPNEVVDYSQGGQTEQSNNQSLGGTGGSGTTYQDNNGNTNTEADTTAQDNNTAPSVAPDTTPSTEQEGDITDGDQISDNTAGAGGSETGINEAGDAGNTEPSITPSTDGVEENTEGITDSTTENPDSTAPSVDSTTDSITDSATDGATNSTDSTTESSTEGSTKSTDNSEVPPPMTYGEWLTLLEEQKNKAVTNAENERERAINDAQVSYQQNKATYGSSAEQLASMGLSGSGYSDYINSRAYAQQRSEIQDANVAAQTAKAQAEQNYAEGKLELAERFNIENKEEAEKHVANFNNVLSYAKSNELTDEEIQQYADMYGFSDEEINVIKNATAVYTENREEAENEAKAEEHRTNFNSLYDLASSSYLSEELLRYYTDVYDLSEVEVGLITSATEAYKDNARQENYLAVLEMASYSVLSEEMISALAGRFDLTEDEVANIKGATAKYTNQLNAEDAEASAEAHRTVVSEMLSLASSTYLDEKEIKFYADAFELTEDEVLMITEATEEYKENKHVSDYLSVLDLAMASELSEEMISALAKQYGLTTEEAESIRAATNAYTNKNNAAVRAEFLSSLGDNIGAIRAAQEAGMITEPDAKNRIAAIQNDNYLSWSYQLSAEDLDIEAIEKDCETGNISEEQLEKLKKGYDRGIVVSKEAFMITDEATGKTGFMTKYDANKYMKEAKEKLDSGWITQETYDALQETYNQYYTAVTADSTDGDVSMTSQIGAVLSGNVGDNELSSRGNNFTIDYNGETYKVESDGAVNSEVIIEAAEDIPDNEVFMYDGDLYVKRSGSVYAIAPRRTHNTDTKNSYYSLLAHFTKE